MANPKPPVTLLAMTGVLALVVLVFPFKWSNTAPPARGVVSLPMWLHAATASTGSLQIGVGVVNTHVSSPARVLLHLADTHQEITLARLGRSTFVWFAEAPLTPFQMATATAGTLQELHSENSVPPAQVPTRIAELARGHNTIFNVPLSDEALLDEHALQEAFTSRIKKGTILDLRKGALPRGKSGFDSLQVKEVIRRLLAGTRAHPGKRFTVGDSEMIIYCPAGVPSILFLMDKANPEADRVEWTTMLYRQTLLASFHRRL